MRYTHKHSIEFCGRLEYTHDTYEYGYLRASWLLWNLHSYTFIRALEKRYMYTTCMMISACISHRPNTISPRAQQFCYCGGLWLWLFVVATIHTPHTMLCIAIHTVLFCIYARHRMLETRSLTYCLFAERVRVIRARICVALHTWNVSHFFQLETSTSWAKQTF